LLYSSILEEGERKQKKFFKKTGQRGIVAIILEENPQILG
jgi:hypothetical protein